jgi:hypothetical protein
MIAAIASSQAPTARRLRQNGPWAEMFVMAPA